MKLDPPQLKLLPIRQCLFCTRERLFAMANDGPGFVDLVSARRLPGNPDGLVGKGQALRSFEELFDFLRRRSASQKHSEKFKSFAALPHDVRKGYAFPRCYLFGFGRGETQPRRKISNQPESQRLSAHQAAKPQSSARYCATYSSKNFNKSPVADIPLIRSWSEGYRRERARLAAIISSIRNC